MSYHPTLSKKFVSPFVKRPATDSAAPRAGPSTSTSNSTPTRPALPSGVRKRKIKDYISDSAGEEDDDGDDLAGGSGSGPSSSARPSATPNDYPDPVARVMGSASLLGRGSPYSRSPATARPPAIGASSLGGGLLPRDGTIRGGPSAEEKENVPETYWMVQWRKPQQKKHKTWDGDAVLIIRGSRCFMKDTDGRDIASAAFTGGTLREGDELRVGGKEIEIDCEIPAQKYLDGSCFGHNPMPITAPTTVTSRPINLKPVTTPHQTPYAASGAVRAPIAAGSFYANKADQVALGFGNQGMRKGAIEPRYNPAAEGAVVMKRPSRDHAAKHNKKNLEIVDVVVHPELGKCLRPHQVEGVKFMYECVMGMRKTEGTGCILADEMGLGKTLQAISLIFTLLQQNAYGGPGAGPVVGKVLVVTPVSLVQNWRKEFHKWLGRQRVGVFVGDGDKQKIRQFANSKGHQVLLIGYEKLRTVVDVIKSSVPPIGLIICDEAHRLKSKDNKTTKMFDALSTKRRILLSGTPLQNDLGEFWAMSDFACPGLLDTYSVFSKIYEKPILKSRAPKCSVKDKELGQARADKLSEITGQFILRRTADILAHYLPPKREYIVFIAPTSLQLEIFAALLTPKVLKAFTRGATAQCLALINHLKKICNCPLLLKAKGDTLDGIDEEMTAATRLIPSGKQDPVPMSGKLLALDRLLTALHRNTEEKIVLVSNYTSTLDVLESYCGRKHYRTLRLDGSTAVKTRQDLVDAFNNGDQHQSFVFLLSSKAGGVGLNLIGASRLVLFDSDWNPSTDLQAQARIHRDGQKRVVHIYRFLTTGTIEEKIYQRQITKLGLSDQLMDQAKSSKNKETDSFSPEELRDLFTVQLKTNGCQTHDLLGCDCVNRELEEIGSEGGVSNAEESADDRPEFVVASQYDGRPSKKQRVHEAEAKQAKLAALLKFTHIDAGSPKAAPLIQDDILYGILGIGKRKKGVASHSVTSAEPSRPPSEFGDSAAEEDIDMGAELEDAASDQDRAVATRDSGKHDSPPRGPPLEKLDGLAEEDLLSMFADTIEEDRNGDGHANTTYSEPLGDSCLTHAVTDPDSEGELSWEASDVFPSDAQDDVLGQMLEHYQMDGLKADVAFQANLRPEAEQDSVLEEDEEQLKPSSKPQKRKGKGNAVQARTRAAKSELHVSDSVSDQEETVSESSLVRANKGKTKSQVKERKAKGKTADKAPADVLDPKKYDLQAIADRGEGGKVMFVFEKVSGSVM